MPRKTIEESKMTRKKIIDCAYRLFTRRGFERTSLTDVAKYAGITRGGVYWHFENKENLLTAVIEETELKHGYMNLLLEAGLPDESDPLNKLKQCINVMVSDPLTEFINSKFVTMIIGIKNGFSGGKELRERLNQVSSKRDTMIKNALINCVTKGQLPAELNVDVALEHLAIFITGYFFQTRTSQTVLISSRFDYVIDKEFEIIKTLTKDVFSSSSKKTKNYQQS